MKIKGYCRTPIGFVEMTLDGSKPVSIRFVSRAKTGTRVPEHAALRRSIKDISDYFTGKRMRFSLREMQGTAFQKKVWKEIVRVPAAATRSYKDIARRVGRPRAVRAVANACGRNPLPILVPCHRIVASGGGLGGYSCGLHRKRWLLAHEARHAKHG